MPCPYQAAMPTVVVYWSGMGCGHGMPCPYIATGYSECRVRLRRQRRPWWRTGREWVADTACRVPTYGGAATRYYFHMEGCDGEVDAWGFLFEVPVDVASMSPSGAHLRRACLGLITLRLSEPFGICDATLTQRRDTACRVRIRRQCRP